MKYLLMIYADEKAYGAAMAANPTAGRALMAAHTAFGEKFKTNLCGGEELQDTSKARTLRSKAGKVVVTTGPFAETKEQLGGYYVIEAATIDEAVHVAEHCPGLETGNTFEVRPMIDHGM